MTAMSLEFVLRGRGGDGQTANIGVNQPLVQGHPEAAIGRNKIHCG